MLASVMLVEKLVRLVRDSVAEGELLVDCGSAPHNSALRISAQQNRKNRPFMLVSEKTQDFKLGRNPNHTQLYNIRGSHNQTKMMLCSNYFLQMTSGGK